jgi:hypothetical protein
MFTHIYRCLEMKVLNCTRTQSEKYHCLRPLRNTLQVMFSTYKPWICIHTRASSERSVKLNCVKLYYVLNDLYPSRLPSCVQSVIFRGYTQCCYEKLLYRNANIYFHILVRIILRTVSGRNILSIINILRICNNELFLKRFYIYHRLVYVIRVEFECFCGDGGREGEGGGVKAL